MTFDYLIILVFVTVILFFENIVEIPQTTDPILEVTFGAAVNGMGHAIVYPVLQSIIAYSFKDSARGLGFGLWNLIGTVGGIGGTVVSTVMAGHVIYGVSGWRCAYLLSATLSTMIGFLMFFFVTDPREKKTRSYVVPNHERHAAFVEMKTMLILQRWRVRARFGWNLGLGGHKRRNQITNISDNRVTRNHRFGAMEYNGFLDNVVRTHWYFRPL
ncbi:unnamed protein product [Thlaspi arvense]|uniref:Major facilitator superfamily (MFS) profile domain-containing protein n=1 Tax=Thlaspi arvense TaxID=13288 RepID=A0AAU9RXR1_THLAR|nr:unnamed protein product [Thlaspi arvense]